jgi:hypothetical protein
MALRWLCLIATWYYNNHSTSVDRTIRFVWNRTVTVDSCIPETIATDRLLTQLVNSCTWTQYYVNRPCKACERSISTQPAVMRPVRGSRLLSLPLTGRYEWFCPTWRGKILRVFLAARTTQHGKVWFLQCLALCHRLPHQFLWVILFFCSSCTNPPLSLSSGRQISLDPRESTIKSRVVRQKYDSSTTLSNR